MTTFERTGGRRLLEGRVALVTGGASGIGRATALLLAREGAAVAVADVNAPEGEAVARSIAEAGGRAVFERCDVAVADECRRAVERTVAELGGLGILFNNAGIMRRATVLDTGEDDWDLIMQVNVKSIFLMSRCAVPVMARAGGGSIINTASDWGLVGGERAAAYCASKGAVVLLTKAMAIDHGPQGIRVNCVCPGDTDTAMLRAQPAQLGEDPEAFLNDAARTPLGRVGRPEDVARAVLFLASDESSFMTGSSLVIDGGGLAGS
ncbi:MAG: SDR family NAD(P)-dependent oxidoreductase [Acidobacteriota bacterium]